MTEASDDDDEVWTLQSAVSVHILRLPTHCHSTIDPEMERQR